MYKLGIIGGMGPEATELLYHKIIKHTEAYCDQEHIDMIILNHASVPDRTKAILEGKEDDVISVLKKDIRLLEGCGVSYIAIPCNTSHCFFEKLKEDSDVDIINMVEETVSDIALKGRKKAGIMCTEGTLKMGLYQKECIKRNIEYVEPDEEIKKLTMDIIYEQIKKGEKGNLEDFSKVTGWFKSKGCDCVLIACTELSVIISNYDIKDDFLSDALDILALKAVKAAGGKIRYEI